MQWTLEQVARSLGLAVPLGQDPLARVAGVSIDSRTVRPGELFIAIHGPRHDGHAFVAQSLAAGASAAVVEASEAGGYSPEIQPRLLVVPDTLASLQRLARAVLAEWRVASPRRRLAAVTGSAGKTTTKEILAAILGARMRVLKSEGNLNNAYGLPLALLRLEQDHDAVVVELGMSRAGEIARLTALAEPEIGVVTCVAPVHLEFFNSIEEIALAKRELIEGLGGNSPVAVLNADDVRVASFAGNFRGRVVTFGIESRANFRAEAIASRGVEGSEWDCVSPSGRARIALPLAGRHNIYNALAALAAAAEWGIASADASDVLGSLSPPPLRGECLRLTTGFTVVNDAYNSNPVALTLAVEAVSATPGYSRRLVAAGEMLELGPASASLHRQCGREAARLGNIDCIFGVAGDAQQIISGAAEEGFPANRMKFFPNSEAAGEFLADFLLPGDLLLVKGSRGVRMEEIVRAIAERHPRAPRPAQEGSRPIAAPSREGSG